MNDAYRRASRRLGSATWLLLFMGVGCSLTINMNELTDGCGAGLEDCNGECVGVGECLAASGGGGTSGSGGESGTSVGKGGKGGGTGGTTPNEGGAGGEGPCTATVWFHYEPDTTVETVHVTGDFTDAVWAGYGDDEWGAWHEPGIKMDDDGTGVFRAVVQMPIGKSLYKFILDYVPGGGDWVYDPSNSLTESDGFTSKNSVLILECGKSYGDGGAASVGGAAGASGGGGETMGGASGMSGAAGAGGG